MFDPAAYFGALKMKEIPAEDELADPRIQRVFKHLANISSSKTKKKLVAMKVTPSQTMQLPSYKKLVLPYQKQETKKLDATAQAKVKVLDLDLAMEEESDMGGIFQLPCHISLTGKQSHCYNVQALTKDKAESSYWSSTMSQQFKPVSHPYELGAAGGGPNSTSSSRMGTPTITIVKQGATD